MQGRVPVNYRQSFKWYGDLDATSVALVATGALAAFRTLSGPGPWLVRLPVIALSLGLGFLLGLGRWPLEYGDNVVTWMKRVLAYRGRSHSGHMIRSLTVSEATRRVFGS